MKIQTISKWLSVLVVCLLVSACGPVTIPDASAGGSGLQAWFDAPLPGSVFAPGNVPVVTHAADESGVSEVELSLKGGGVLGSQQANPGENLVTASFTWQAASPGSYTLAVRALNVNGDWSAFAFIDVVIESEETPVAELPVPENISSEETPTPEKCSDLAGFVGETVADNTVFSPGDGFTKTWTLRNVGTCTWTTRYALSYYDGNQMGGPRAAGLQSEVLPGETITLSVNLNAPSQNGSYKGRWMLMNPQGILFGLGGQGTVAFWVQIVVGQADSQAPSVSVAYSPNGRGEPTGRQRINFTASAADDGSIAKIEIYLKKEGASWVLIGSCTSQNSCTIQGGPYSPGDYKLRAFATDAAGNEGNSGIVSFHIYT